MGRDYAGILGSLAFFIVMTRGLVRGAGVESTLLAAAIHLGLFAFVGYIVGQLAAGIVLDSVRTQMRQVTAHSLRSPWISMIKK